MMYFRKITPIVAAAQWRGDNFDEVKRVCPEARIDKDNRLWIPSLFNPYCVKVESFVVRQANETGRKLIGPYRAYTKEEFFSTFELVCAGGE